MGPQTMKTELGRARTPLRAVVADHATLRAARNGVRALPLPTHFQVGQVNFTEGRGF